MSLQNLLDEVELISSTRNHEVILSIFNRICNYQKVKLKLYELLEENPNIKINENYLAWKSLRGLRKKISLKIPCGICIGCR